MSHRKITLTLFFGLLLFAAHGQITFQPHVVRIIANDPSIVPYDGNKSTDPAFDQLMQEFEVVFISRPLAFAKTPELQNCFELYTPLNEDDFGQALMAYNETSGKLHSVELVPTVKYLDPPNDYFWYAYDNEGVNFVWYLQKIHAEEAWDITHGDPNVKVAVIDQGIDATHPELTGKVYPQVDFYTGQPFTTDPGSQSHGTSVSTLIAAETTPVGVSNLGAMPSIGWDTRIMFASSEGAAPENFPDPDPGNESIYSFARPDIIAMDASTNQHAKVINVSWYFFEYNDAYAFYLNNYPSGLESYILMEREILNNGTCIVRAAGNYSSDGIDSRLYPFSGHEDERTIVVSSTGPDDKHFYIYNNAPYTNSHYPEVDLCAPGYTLLCGKTTDNGQSDWPYVTYGGTSQSTPLVVGTIALMYAVNPCLSPAMVQDILKRTTDPIVDAADYPGVIGTGRLNAYEAVLEAQNSPQPTTLDLYIKDRPEDWGWGPWAYDWQAPRDESPDIWVRNQPDGLTNQTHQEPEYDDDAPVYVYVRVRNRSCVASAGDAVLKLYWTMASSMTSWPQNWDGSLPNVGGVIGTEDIYLQPGEEQIIMFEWNIQNPHIYNNWATCLMARIENSPADPITIYPNNAADDVYFNNNIALRNCTVIDFYVTGIGDDTVNGIIRPNGKYVYLSNESIDPQLYNFTFDSHDENLITAGEITLFFDAAGWTIVKPYFAGSSDFTIVNDGTVRMKSSSGKLSGVSIPGKTKFAVYVGFNFFADVEQGDQTYKFDIYQQTYAESAYIGGEHYTIRRAPRNPFHADAGEDQSINNGSPVTFSAGIVSEEVIYNWYDSDGKLLHTGQDLTQYPTSNQTYILEVTATSDGAKSYDEVSVIVKHNYIESVSPNPASSTVQVTYELADGVTSANLLFLNQSTSHRITYTLDVNQNSITINISSLQTGAYTVVLVCNSVNMDSKVLVKQ